MTDPETLREPQGPEPRKPRTPAQAVCELQRERIREYKRDPNAAWTTDRAWTEASGAHAADAMHSSVELGTRHTARIPIAVHERVGGWHDHPVPGDVLAAALASCADSTLRVVAARLGVQIESLAVTAEADVDVRGTLCIAPDVPVGFQRMRLTVRLRVAPGADPARVDMLRAAGEHCCVVLQTLRSGVPVDVDYPIA
jgi:uncharacterized OsmC-like protein